MMFRALKSIATVWKASFIHFWPLILPKKVTNLENNIMDHSLGVPDYFRISLCYKNKEEYAFFMNEVCINSDVI